MDTPPSPGSTATAATSSLAEAGSYPIYSASDVSTYKTASAVLGAFFGLACCAILFLLLILRRTRKRQRQPVKARIARFTDDASVMSQTTSSQSLSQQASSNPFADPEPIPASPILARAATLKESLGESLGFSVQRRPQVQKPVSELFLTVPQPRFGSGVENNNSESDLSRVGTNNSVDERPSGLQGLYVSNHSQFTVSQSPRLHRVVLMRCYSSTRCIRKMIVATNLGRKKSTGRRRRKRSSFRAHCVILFFV